MVTLYTVGAVLAPVLVKFNIIKPYLLHQKLLNVSLGSIPNGKFGGVSWSHPLGVSPLTGYDVEYSSDNGTTWKHASSTFHSDTATHHVVKPLTNGTSYVFRVAAINGSGTGAYSAKSGAVTPQADATSLTTTVCQ